MWKVRRRRKEERRRTRRPEKSCGRSGKRKREKGDDETDVVQRRCVNPVSSDACEELSHVEDSSSCGNSWSDLLGYSGGLSECVPEVSSGVLGVTEVLGSPSSVVVMRDALSDSDWETVEPQSLFFLQKTSSRSCGESRRHEL